MKKAAGNTKNRKKQAGDALVCFFYADLFFRLADRLIARLANSFDNLAERAVVGAHGVEALTGDFTGIADDDDLLMKEVIGEDSDLFFLDAYLRDILQKR